MPYLVYGKDDGGIYLAERANECKKILRDIVPVESFGYNKLGIATKYAEVYKVVSIHPVEFSTKTEFVLSDEKEDEACLK